MGWKPSSLVSCAVVNAGHAVGSFFWTSTPQVILACLGGDFFLALGWFGGSSSPLLALDID